MSLKLQGKIHRFKMVEYSLAMGNSASPELLRTAKHLWLVFAEYYNDGSGQCNPSNQSLINYMEISRTALINAKNLLIELKLVTVLKNAKGGRTSPWYSLNFPRYDEFSHPVGRTANSPVDSTPKYDKQHPSHPVGNIKQSVTQDTTHVADRTRILIEPLDKSLIKSLLDESNSKERIQKLSQFAEKYGYKLTSSTPLYMVEDFLRNLTTDLSRTPVLDNKEVLLNKLLRFESNAST
jgi:Helix-turn-helix domain